MNFFTWIDGPKNVCDLEQFYLLDSNSETTKWWIKLIDEYISCIINKCMDNICFNLPQAQSYSWVTAFKLLEVKDFSI